MGHNQENEEDIMGEDQMFLEEERKSEEVVPEKKISTGAYLKKVRESKGISLETVHESTKIPMDTLRAIEEGYTVRTLSEYYQKSFKKVYANYLKLDVSEVIEDFKKEKLPEQLKEEEKDFDVSQWLMDYFTPDRVRSVIKIVFVFIVLFLVFKFIVFVKDSAISRSSKVPVTAVKDEKSTMSQISKKEVVKKVVQPEKKMPPIKVTAKVTKPVVIPAVNKTSGSSVRKKITLTVRTRKRGWLRVIADDVVVFQAVLERGAVETWLADERIEISGRYLSELEFELNEKMIGPLGRGDRQAKKILVTKDGLSLSK